MKKILHILIFTMVIGAGFTYSSGVKAQSVSVNLSLFQNSLNPYGRWVNHPRFGQIWISNTRGFVPYQTGGHWAYTDYGWTWVSDYDWGWAPFHYGRWGYEPSYGWYWVPGYQWSPAWVAWRSDNDYYGWAPLSPGINISVGASFNAIPYDRWVFAPHRYITSPSIGRYYVPRSRNVTIIKNTTFVNNVTVKNNVHYVSGPRVQDVERVNHTKIQTLTVANSSRAGRTVVNNKTVNVYRPVINNEKVTVNNNNKTVINKNSNNKTVEKNSNNTTVNKNKTEVNKNKTVEKNSNNKEVNKNNNNKETNKTIHKPQPKKQQPAQHKQPAPKKKLHDGQSAIKQNAAAHDVAKAKVLQNRKAVVQKAKAAKQDVAKRKTHNNNNSD